jgi:predicted acylesterase/phospholipase RssA
MYLVIGSGGMAIYSFLGSISVIDFDTIDEVSCASAGSILGLLICIGKTIEEIKNICFSIDLKELTSINIKSFITKYGFISHEPIKKVLRKFCGGDPTFKQLSKKLYVTSFCVNKSETEYFSVDTFPDMSVIDAVCMSISVPFLFESVVYNSFTYIDGGIHESLPMMAFIHKDPKDVLIIKLEQDKRHVPEIKTIKSFVDSIVQLMMINRINYKISSSKTISINLGDVNIFNFLMEHDDKLRLYMIGYQLAKIHCHLGASV